MLLPMSSATATQPHDVGKSSQGETRYGGFGPQAKKKAAERTFTSPAGKPGPPGGQQRGRRRAAGAVLIAVGVQLLCGTCLLVAVRLYKMRVERARELAYWAGVHHAGPVAGADALHGDGRVYLLPMDAVTQPYGAAQVAEWLRSKYKLEVQVLPALPPDRAAWDPQRKQYVAELLGEQIDRAHPEVAAEPAAVVIGITRESMYLARESGDLSYSARLNEHAAVVSTYGFGEHGLLERWAFHGQEAQGAGGVPAKLRRFVLKDLALLHWHLRMNNDPSSVLHDPLDPGLPSEDIYASDLQPQSTQWGESMNSPCLYFTWTARAGMQPMSGPSLRPCERKLLSTADESQEIVQVDLLAQVVRDARTDLYLADSVPIAFERVLRPGGTNPTEFGASGSHSYDKFLWAESMALLHRVGPEFTNEDLRRVPWWLPVESLDKWVDAESSGRWLTMTDRMLPREHFELKDLHGNVETYMTCEGKIPCYLDGYRNAQGQALRFERSGKDRRLDRLVSPNGSWLKLSYDAKNRLTEIRDNHGRAVRYGYNAQDQLVRVTHADGELMSYAYDGQQRLVAVSAAPDETAVPQELMRNTYDAAGWLTRQTLGDGGVYSYVRHPVAGRGRMWLTVTTPDGHSTDVYGEGWHAALWSKEATPVPEKVQARR